MDTKNKSPERTCLGCRSRKPKESMIRVIRTPEGRVTVASRGKENGRGAYICPEEACIARAFKTGAFARALKTGVSGADLENLREEILGAVREGGADHEG